jgi:hypothetical protein
MAATSDEHLRNVQASQRRCAKASYIAAALKNSPFSRTKLSLSGAGQRE